MANYNDMEANRNGKTTLDIIAITIGIIASTFVAINFGWQVFEKARQKRREKEALLREALSKEE
jgi:hypothetical protein